MIFVFSMARLRLSSVSCCACEQSSSSAAAQRLRQPTRRPCQALERTAAALRLRQRPQWAFFPSCIAAGWGMVPGNGES
jgi:hypothetical protein